MKKVLYLIFSESPSSVVRAEIFNDIYIKNGYDVSYYYDYSSNLNSYINKISKYKFLFFLSLILRIIRKLFLYIKRYFLLRNIYKYDAVIIIKYINPDFLYKVRNIFKKYILYDFDDAIWLPMFFGDCVFEKILSSVDFVSCDNYYLLEKSLELNNRSFILNGPSAIEKYDLDIKSQKSDNITIGWIGSPSTIFYLYSIYDVLEQLGSKYSQVELLIIGSGYNKSAIPPFEKIKVRCIPEYNEKGMIKYVNTIDIGIYPLFYNQLSLGRGSLKAIIYMSAKVPVVAAAIGGENENIISNGSNGFLASNNNEWYAALELLICDSKLREKIGNAGFEHIKTKYSVDSCFNQLHNNFLIKI